MRPALFMQHVAAWGFGGEVAEGEEKTKTWTAKQWELVVKQVGEEDWGAVAHGGARTKKAKDVSEPLKLEHAASVEHAIVASRRTWVQ